MGAFLFLIDAILFVYFIVMAMSPVITAQLVLPPRFFPGWMIDYSNWYTGEFDDYVMVEKPLFAVGLALVELIFQWPLALASLYGMLARKSWYSTTCLVHGATYFTTMVTVLTEMIGSGKASDKLLNMCYPFLGFTVLAMLRGMIPSSKSTSPSNVPKRKRM